MGNGPSVEENLFNLKFTSKQMIRESQKMEKQEKAERIKIKKVK